MWVSKRALHSLMLIIIWGAAPEMITAQFRNIDFGASRSEIIKAKGKPDKDASNRLMYETVVMGYKANEVFHIVDGEFHQGLIDFTTDHTNRELDISRFHAINDVLIEKYGYPTQGRNSLIIKDLSLYNSWKTIMSESQLFEVGVIYYRSDWNFGDYKISNQMYMDSFLATHGVFYTSKNFESKKMKEALSDF